MRPVLGPVRHRPGPGRGRPGRAGAGPAAAARRSARPGADRAACRPWPGCATRPRPAAWPAPSWPPPASTTATPPRRPGWPRASSAGTSGQVSDSLECLGRPPGTAGVSPPMPAIPSRCWRSPPPWPTSADWRGRGYPARRRQPGAARHRGPGGTVDPARPHPSGRRPPGPGRRRGPGGPGHRPDTRRARVRRGRAPRAGHDRAASRRHRGRGPAHGRAGRPRCPQFAGVYARAETTAAQAQVTEARDGPAAALGHLRSSLRRPGRPGPGSSPATPPPRPG